MSVEVLNSRHDGHPASLTARRRSVRSPTPTLQCVVGQQRGAGPASHFTTSLLAIVGKIGRVPATNSSRAKTVIRSLAAQEWSR